MNTYFSNEFLVVDDDHCKSEFSLWCPSITSQLEEKSSKFISRLTKKLKLNNNQNGNSNNQTKKRNKKKKKEDGVEIEDDEQQQSNNQEEEKVTEFLKSCRRYGGGKIEPHEMVDIFVNFVHPSGYPTIPQQNSSNHSNLPTPPPTSSSKKRKNKSSKSSSSVLPLASELVLKGDKRGIRFPSLIRNPILRAKFLKVFLDQYHPIECACCDELMCSNCWRSFPNHSNNNTNNNSVMMMGGGSTTSNNLYDSLTRLYRFFSLFISLFFLVVVVELLLLVTELSFENVQHVDLVVKDKVDLLMLNVKLVIVPLIGMLPELIIAMSIEKRKITQCMIID